MPDHSIATSFQKHYKLFSYSDISYGTAISRDLSYSAAIASKTDDSSMRHNKVILQKFGGSLPFSVFNLGTDSSEVTSIAYSPDNKLVAFSGLHYLDNFGVPPFASVLLYHTDSAKIFRKIFAHRRGTGTIAFAPNGKTLLTIGQDSEDGMVELRLWEIETGREIKQHNLRTIFNDKSSFPYSSIGASTFSPNGRMIYLAIENSILVIDPSKGKVVQTCNNIFLRLKEKSQRRSIDRRAIISNLEVSASGNRLLVFGEDIHIFELDPLSNMVLRGAPGLTQESGSVVSEPDRRFLCPTISPDGKTVAIGQSDGTIHLWDPTFARETITLTVSTTAIPRRIRFSQDGSMLQCLDSEGVLHRWVTATTPVKP